MMAELLVDASAVVGEGPVWDTREGVLWWVDIPKRRLYRYDPRTFESTSQAFAEPIGAVGPRKAGGLIAATLSGFAMIEGDEFTPLVSLSGEDPVPSRMNDAACDAAGRFWAGRVPLEAQQNLGVGSLWRLGTEGRADKVLDGISLANGIDWSPDGSTMYFVDSFAFAVYAFDFDVAAGTPSNRRTVLAFPEAWDPLHVPDGLCVDDEGALWIAFWGGSNVRRFAPDGAPLGEVRLPVSQVTSCAFGGEDFGDLYITTAAAEGEPGSGGLWRVRPGVRGRAPHAYVG